MEFKEQLDQVTKEIGEKLKGIEEQNKINGKSNEDAIEALKNMGTKHTELTEKFEAYESSVEEKLKTVQDHADELDLKLQKADTKGGDNEHYTAKLQRGLIEGIKEHADNLKISNNPSKTPIAFELDYKADMTSAVHTVNQVVDPHRIAGVFYDPANPNRIRGLLGGGSTSSNEIFYTQETLVVDNTAPTAEAVAKPQNEYTLTNTSKSVRKIANYVRLPEEMANDITYMQSYLSTRLIDAHNDVEDVQLLVGDNTGQNLHGIIPQAGAYVDVISDAAATEYDVLRMAVAQAEVLHYMSTGILIHPTRYAQMSLLKDSQGRFLNESLYNGVNPNVGGVPVIKNTAIDSNAFLVGDFRRGAQLYDRMSANVRFYDQDQDNAITNMITIVAEKRLCLVVPLGNAFVASTDFDAAVVAAQT